MKLLSRVLLILFHHLALLQASKAQYSLPDVPLAFSTMTVEPHVFHLKRNHINIPSGGHLQGIQALTDSTFIISGSSSSCSYYLTTDLHKILSLHNISDSPYRHAGGCQLIDGQLIVGVEDNEKKDRSIIYSIRFDDRNNQFSKALIIKREGFYKRSTAGASGFVKLSDGRYIIAIADWDSRNIDFYCGVSFSPLLRDSVITYHAPDQGHWCSYQSINLLTDTAGKVYLIGFALDGAINKADLFELTIADGKADLRLVSTRNFRCKGTGFRYAAGIDMSKDGKLAIYSCSRRASPDVVVNVFR